MDSKILFGTHNSGTCYKLVWWQRIFGFILNLVSRCQSRSIVEQLRDGVILFNFQVCHYRNDWYFSHGLCVYDGKLFDALSLIEGELFSDVNKKIYIQLSLDKNFLIGQDIDRFKVLVNELLNKYNNDVSRLRIISCVIEGGERLFSDSNHGLYYEEKYWTSSFVGSFMDKLPLPSYHAKKYNRKYIESCKKDILMLDFYDRY